MSQEDFQRTFDAMKRMEQRCGNCGWWELMEWRGKDLGDCYFPRPISAAIDKDSNNREITSYPMHKDKPASDCSCWKEKRSQTPVE